MTQETSSVKTIRIATRKSPLALWQTHAVKQQLETLGYSCEIVLIESTGDLQLTQPLYALGTTGIFTKQLDIALLNNQADIAVHSLKDVPTKLAEGLLLASVLERGSDGDVAVVKNPDLLQGAIQNAVIASSSLRRAAQWLGKFPTHTIVPIRGNVQTRLKKFHEDATLDAIVFAKAGLERMDLLTDKTIELDWMMPAPAQGIIGIVCREQDGFVAEACKKINHQPSFVSATVERQFLNTLMGGCSVPISALAEVNDSNINFSGAIHSFDGKQHFSVSCIYEAKDWVSAGQRAAHELLGQAGVAELMDVIRNKKWDEADIIN